MGYDKTIKNKNKEIAKESGITVFYSPHYYTEEEYKNWTHINFVDKVMFNRNMFLRGRWGSEFHPDLQPDDNTIVLSPHKGLSNFQTGDINVQLRQRNIKTLSDIVAELGCKIHGSESHYLNNSELRIIVYYEIASAENRELVKQRLNYYSSESDY